MHEPSLLRAYLDANVLFSASLSEQNGFLNFWRLRGIVPVTSDYAVREVFNNLTGPGHAERFRQLLGRTDRVSDADVRLIPSGISLAEKDRQILASAIGSSVDYLVTGDRNHFSHLYASSVSGVYVMGPKEFLALFEDRLIP